MNHLAWESNVLLINDQSSTSRSFIVEEKEAWLEFPVTVGYMVNPDAKCRISVIGGSSMRLLLSSKTDLATRSASGYSKSVYFDVTEKRQNWTLLANVGINLELTAFEKMTLGFSLLLEHNVTSIVDVPEPDPNLPYGYSVAKYDIRLTPLTLSSFFLF